MSLVRLAIALLVWGSLGLPARADELPPWATQKARCEAPAGGTRAFVAVGRSGDTGPADFKSEQAEDDARQQMGQLIADWQEAALACAKKATETTTKAKSRSGTGALLDFTFESATTVSFYRDRVTGRAYDGKTILVLLRHEVGAMVSGIVADPDRSAALKEAVKVCGEKAFDTLAARTQ